MDESQKPQNSGEVVERDKQGRFVKGHSKKGGIKKNGVHTFTNFKNIIIAKLEADPKMANDIADYYLHNPRMKELLWKMIDGMPQGSAPIIPIQINQIFSPQDYLEASYEILGKEHKLSKEEIKAKLSS